MMRILPAIYRKHKETPEALRAQDDGPRETSQRWMGLGSQEGDDGHTHEQIVEAMGDHPWEQAAGFFVSPGPDHTAPEDTDETEHAVSMRYGK